MTSGRGGLGRHHLAKGNLCGPGQASQVFDSNSQIAFTLLWFEGLEKSSLHKMWTNQVEVEVMGGIFVSYRNQATFFANFSPFLIMCVCVCPMKMYKF